MKKLIALGIGFFLFFGLSACRQEDEEPSMFDTPFTISQELQAELDTGSSLVDIYQLTQTSIVLYFIDERTIIYDVREQTMQEVPSDLFTDLLEWYVLPLTGFVFAYQDRVIWYDTALEEQETMTYTEDVLNLVIQESYVQVQLDNDSESMYSYDLIVYDFDRNITDQKDDVSRYFVM
jgi:hypothetical protein